MFRRGPFHAGSRSPLPYPILRRMSSPRGGLNNAQRVPELLVRLAPQRLHGSRQIPDACQTADAECPCNVL